MLLIFCQLRQALKEIPETPEGKNPFSEQLPDSWMAPGRDYVAPSSSFFFAPGIQKTSLMAYLPSKILVDKLMDHYWTAVHVIARTVHQPSFERQYIRFWAEISSGLEPRNSFQAVLFAALLSSVISMSEEKILTEYGVAKDGLVENFKQGTEAALARANFLSTTKLETLQAFVMYLVSGIVFPAHSSLSPSSRFFTFKSTMAKCNTLLMPVFLFSNDKHSFELCSPWLDL